MAADWWEAILSMIPARLVSSTQLQPHIKELYDEVKVQYEASIRKAMGENWTYCICIHLLLWKTVIRKQCMKTLGFLVERMQSEAHRT